MQWKDNQQRAWTCRLTIADIKRLKTAGFDVGDPEAFQTVFASALTVIEVISEAMRPQWEKLGLTYEQFSELLIEADDRLTEVQACFVQGLVDFFHRLGDGAMSAVVEKAMTAAERSKKARLARVESGAVEALIEKALAKEESDFQKMLAEEGAKLSGETSTSVRES